MPRRPRLLSPEERKLLDHLFEVHKMPKEFGKKGLFYAKITEMFNNLTTGNSLSILQIRRHHNDFERELWMEKQCPERLKRKSTLHFRGNLKRNTSRGYVLPLPETEEGHSRTVVSTLQNESDNEAQIGEETSRHQGYAKSNDLVYILRQQAHQHHMLKMKLLNRKLCNAAEVQQLKMKNLNEELEMKRQEHNKKLEILKEKYKKANDQSQFNFGMNLA